MYPFAALLALSLCAEPQDGANKPDPAKPAGDIVKVEADVRAIFDRLGGIEKALKKYDDQHTKLVTDLAETFQAQINDINKKLNALRADVDDIKRSRTSVSEKRNDATTPMATVMLVNSRPDMPMETVINGATFVVGPSQDRVVSVPAGALQIRVKATDAIARERTLVAGATHVVTLR